jgi:IS5 family transposase
MPALIGNILDRCISDAGYRGHNAPPDHKFKVYAVGQKRRVTPQIKGEFKRRAGIEPVIGHLKEHHRMGRNTSPMQAATPSMPCSPPPATTSVALAWLSLLLLRILIALGLAGQLPRFAAFLVAQGLC